MEALLHYRVAFLLTLGFFVPGVGSWLLYASTGSELGPAALFLATALWVGGLEAGQLHRDVLPHPVGGSVLVVLGPALLVTSDLVGRSVSGEVLTFDVFARWGGIGLAAFAVTALVAHFVVTLTGGLDRYDQRVRQ